MLRFKVERDAQGKQMVRVFEGTELVATITGGEGRSINVFSGYLHDVRDIPGGMTLLLLGNTS